MFIWTKAGLARWETRLAEPTFLFLIQTVRRVLWGNVGSPRVVRFGDRPRYRAKFSPYKRDIRSGVWLYSVWVALIPDNFDSLLLSDLSETCHFQVRSGTSLALTPREKMTSSVLVHVAWVNSRHFVTPLPVSLRNDVSETRAEISYWWRVNTQIWVVLLSGWSKFLSWHDQSEAQPYLGSDASWVWNLSACSERGFGARENRGAPLAFLSRPKTPFAFRFKRLSRRLLSNLVPMFSLLPPFPHPPPPPPTLSLAP